MNAKDKKDPRLYTEKIKETLRVFTKIKEARDAKSPVVRNYGPEYEIEQMREFDKQELHRLMADAIHEEQDLEDGLSPAKTE